VVLISSLREAIETVSHSHATADDSSQI